LLLGFVIVAVLGASNKPGQPNRNEESIMHNRSKVRFPAGAPRRSALALPIALGIAAFATGAANAESSLYDRLGGLQGITVVVDDLIDRLVVNATLNQNPAINAGRKNSPTPYLKFQVSQLVCEVTGGPCKYTGAAMKPAHAHLNISESEWNVMAGEFKKSLDKYKVPTPEQTALFEIVGKTKADIVIRK
jgi:hemoglobin